MRMARKGRLPSGYRSRRQRDADSRAIRPDARVSVALAALAVDDTAAYSGTRSKRNAAPSRRKHCRSQTAEFPAHWCVRCRRCDWSRFRISSGLAGLDRSPCIRHCMNEAEGCCHSTIHQMLRGGVSADGVSAEDPQLRRQDALIIAQLKIADQTQSFPLIRLAAAHFAHYSAIFKQL